MNKEKIIKAGEIAIQAKEYAKSIAKKDTPLLEIAEKIEAKIIELGGKPAFPVNTSINEIAAHYTPSHNDETLAHGLLKIDLGVHIDGWVADTAMSIDLEDSEENKKLIEVAKESLDNAIKVVKLGTTVGEIGEIIQETMESKGFSPIINLSGHSIEKYNLHAGLTIPNVGNGQKEEIEEGTYAIEPFATNGAGKVRDGNPSGIYEIIDTKNPRSPIAREVLDYLIDEHQTLPFCSRWIIKKFGTKALIGLKQLEENGNLHNYPQLIETGNGIVAQAEHTILVEKDNVKITT